VKKELGGSRQSVWLLYNFAQLGGSMRQVFISRIILVSLLVCLLAVFHQIVEAHVTAGIADTDWPMFQHDTAHSGQSSFEGISAYPVEIWKVKLYGFAGESSSGISIGTDGTLYTSANGWLSAIDVQNRSIKWVFQHADNSRSVPAIADDGTLYWGYGDSFAAISTTGQIEWEWPNLTGNYVFGSSPVVDQNGNIYFSHDGVWSLEKNGDFRWFYPSTFFGHSSPAIGSDGTIYVAVNEAFIALNPNGTLKWSLPFKPNDNTPTLANDGTIYVGVIDAGASEFYPAKLLAIDPNGTLKWTFPMTGVYSIAVPPALGPDGTIYFGDGSTYNPPPEQLYFYALNPMGTLKWKIPIPAMLTVPPVTDRLGRVYFCDSSYCYGVDPNGHILWQIYLPPDDIGPLGVYSAPLITADGVMVILDSHGYIHVYVEPSGIIYLPIVSRQ
jgi:hypothetical protein